jgi:hypothetical protein
MLNQRLLLISILLGGMPLGFAAGAAPKPAAVPPPISQAQHLPVDGPAALRDRFDRVVTAAVEQATRKPGTNADGHIAWGNGKQLAALVEMLEVTQDEKYAHLAVKPSDWIADARDHLHDIPDEVRGRVLPEWSATRYSKGKRYVWAVHTGIIASSMARFAAVVRSSPTLKERWAPDAGRLLKIAEDAVAAHEEEFRQGPAANEGYLHCPYMEKHLPLNMQNAMAEAWMAIDDATQTPRHRERVERLAWFLKTRTRALDDGSLVWAYWPSLEGKEKSFEDISHAAMNVNFIVRCYERGIVFTRDDIDALGKTLLKRVLTSDDQISDTIGGGGPFNKHRTAPLRWARLGRHIPEVQARLLGYSQSPEFEKDNSSWLAGAACLSSPPAAMAGE